MYEITQRFQVSHQALSTGETQLCSSKQKEAKSLAKAKEKLGLKKHHLQIAHYFEVT